MTNQLTRLIDLFTAYVSDRSTLDELRKMVSDEATWGQGQELFSQIRAKTLAAEKRRDPSAECQYLFEEVCAKTLYNMSSEPVPFDPDSSYWIVPNALSLARRLDIPESEITRIVAS